MPENKKNYKCVFVFAHPDDAEITSYGTIKTFLELNYSIHLIIVTGGNNGISVIDKDKTGVHHLDSKIREKETLDAFKDLKIDITFLDIPQKDLTFNFQNVTILERELLKQQPDILVTHFLDNTGNDHQEHSVISKIIRNISNRLYCLKLYLVAEPIKSFKCHFEPNYFVDITEYFEEKCASLSHHTSQKDRFYMSKEFHLMRCQKNALSFNTSDFEKGKLYESFHVIKSSQL